MATKRSTWEKITWTWRPASEREAGDSIVRNFLLHWFPAKVMRESLSWSYSFWLGTTKPVVRVLVARVSAVTPRSYMPSWMFADSRTR